MEFVEVAGCPLVRCVSTMGLILSGQNWMTNMSSTDCLESYIHNHMVIVAAQVIMQRNCLVIMTGQESLMAIKLSPCLHWDLVCIRIHEPWDWGRHFIWRNQHSRGMMGIPCIVHVQHTVNMSHTESAGKYTSWKAEFETPCTIGLTALCQWMVEWS